MDMTPDELDAIRDRHRNLKDYGPINAAVDDVGALLVEVDRVKRAAQTLGGIVQQNGRMILDITGLHDWIDQDGDGDWGAVWENAYELLPRINALTAVVDRVRALTDEADRSGRHINGYGYVIARDLHAALGEA